ncbi:hypothetical protein SAMN04488026_104537 [Aliiruegeria lutimaris]|uniref:Uncharacterized protein n=1 Tax=Aliiruegeria lutimaris TaxID=571298 RepID=A0A1G9D2T0_9RHOB|nr:hypothetical protein SAMN04488026_104537 [Aliiruegeria lutimaris]
MDVIDRLDEYLTSESAPEESMAISDLDGFLTGLGRGAASGAKR